VFSRFGGGVPSGLLGTLLDPVLSVFDPLLLLLLLVVVLFALLLVPEFTAAGVDGSERSHRLNVKEEVARFGIKRSEVPTSVAATVERWRCRREDCGVMIRSEAQLEVEECRRIDGEKVGDRGTE
jgi:hypothetical protein